MKKALIQLHAAVLLWGFTGVLGKLISLDAPVLVWYRMALTAVIILGILLVNKRWMRVPQKDVLRLTVIGGLMAVHWVAFYAAIKYANASIALVCLSTSSIFTSLLDPLVNKTKYNSRELALGCLALAGMYLIYHFQQLYVIGIVLGVIAAMLSSVFTILNKRIADRYPSGTMVFYEMTTGFAIISLLLPLVWYYTPGLQLLPRQDSLGTISTGFPGSLLTGHHDWIWLLFMALCCTVWAQTLALNALKKLSSFTITLTVNMEPVYGILLAVIVFREDRDLSMGFFAGMGLICLSVVLQMYLLLRENSKLRKLRTADAAVVAPPDISEHTDKGQRQ